MDTKELLAYLEKKTRSHILTNRKLPKRISLSAQNVSLEDVLQKIAEQTKSELIHVYLDQEEDVWFLYDLNSHSSAASNLNAQVKTKVFEIKQFELFKYPTRSASGRLSGRPLSEGIRLSGNFTQVLKKLLTQRIGSLQLNKRGANKIIVKDTEIALKKITTFVNYVEAKILNFRNIQEQLEKQIEREESEWEIIEEEDVVKRLEDFKREEEKEGKKGGIFY